MPFGNKAREVRAFEFGCLPPVAGEVQAVEAMRARNTLWNALVALEREHQARVDEILAPHVEGAEDRKAARRAAWKLPEIKEQAHEWDRATIAQARELCKASGLYWCNYDDVLLSWMQARRKPGDLRFHAWRDEIGKLTVRWQTGLPVAEAFGDDTRMQLEPVDAEAAYRSPVRAVRRKAAQSSVRLRVASEERKPVWIELPCVLHREIPPGGLVRQASVLRERVGTKYRWKLVLVVELPERTVPSAEDENADTPASVRSIGIDLGWRRRYGEDDDGKKRFMGLRVATWRDAVGRGAEIILSPEWFAGMQLVENLRSIRDNHLNAMKVALINWIEQFPGVADLEWWERGISRVGQWRSPARFAALALRWREARFEGDAEGYKLLEMWRKKDKHLYEFESNLRDRLLRHRREIYRRFAASIVKRYGVVRVEDVKLSRLARRDSVQDADPCSKEALKRAQHYRQWAGVSTLRLAVKNACQREGVRYEEVKTANTTRYCLRCGAITEENSGVEIVTRCGECGHASDQDYRAAQNILSQNPPDFEQKTGLRRNGGNMAQKVLE